MFMLHLSRVQCPIFLMFHAPIFCILSPPPPLTCMPIRAAMKTNSPIRNIRDTIAEKLSLIVSTSVIRDGQNLGRGGVE